MSERPICDGCPLLDDLVSAAEAAKEREACYGKMIRDRDLRIAELKNRITELEARLRGEPA